MFPLQIRGAQSVQWLLQCCCSSNSSEYFFLFPLPFSRNKAGDRVVRIFKIDLCIFLKKMLLDIYYMNIDYFDDFVFWVFVLLHET